MCSAQTAAPPTIRIEAREVIFPVRVIKERKDPKGLLLGPNREAVPVWLYHTEEVTGLSAKSFRLYEDGVEQRIRHFSVEEGHGWLVKDNVGEHIEYAWTPTGIWSGSDEKEVSQSLPARSFHTYLVSYIPPRSPAGSCHRIALKVAKRNAKIFAPDQYCNTKNPLSDPLNERAAGDTLLEYANSQRPSSIPLALQLGMFSGSSDASRLDVSVGIPPELLKREWRANQLVVSVALLGLVYDKKHTLVDRFSDTVCPAPECDIWYEGPIPPSDVLIPQLRDAEKHGEHLTVPRSYRTQLDLEPGDYQVEIVITDGEKFGRAEASVNLDDFRKSELAISGITLCRRYHAPSADESGPTRAPQYIPLMFGGQQFTPAGDPHFKRGEPLMTYVEIYDNSQAETAAPKKLYLEMKVTDTKTGELRIGSGPRPVNSSTESRGTIPVVWTMAVDRLPPSSYRLEAQASDSAGNKTTWRVASFTID